MEDEARRLLDHLARHHYRFVTPTPATHERVLARPGREQANDLADVFGWSLPFKPSLLDDRRLQPLRDAGLVLPDGAGLLRATVRVSSLGGDLYLHSAFPTDTEDAVFFGPDSYRFADFISAELTANRQAAARIIDIGTGSGVGAIVAAQHRRDAEVVATDVNPAALRFARVNAGAANVRIEVVCGDLLEGVGGAADLILANPPYIIDDAGRTYRDGGDLLGAGVALEMTDAALGRLTPGGRFLLYSGSAIVRGEDRLHAELARRARAARRPLRYREIDPDVFGEELAKPAYREVDRIAVIAAVIG